MAVLAGQVVKRQGRDGGIKSAGVAANTVIQDGTFVFLDANKFATDVREDEFTVLGGIARGTVNNLAGTDGDLHAEFWSDGDFELPFAISEALTKADIGLPIYASDNYTPTKTDTGNPKIGVLVGVATSTRGIVSIQGLGD